MEGGSSTFVRNTEILRVRYVTLQSQEGKYQVCSAFTDFSETRRLDLSFLESLEGVCVCERENSWLEVSVLAGSCTMGKKLHVVFADFLMGPPCMFLSMYNRAADIFSWSDS